MITDSEIDELERLLELQLIDENIDQLTVFDEKTNPNYKFLRDTLDAQEWGVDDKGIPVLLSGHVGVLLEGSSRSQKTWGGLFFVVWLCLYEKKPCTINIYRDTYNEFKTTLYDDFRRILSMFGLPNPFINTKEIKSFTINNCTIYFLGDGKHGGGSDYSFYNEIMLMDQEVVMQSKMRCRKFWWADYNPSFTDHWVFDKLSNRMDVDFLRTTFRTNVFISYIEKNEILGYEPWEVDSYETTNDEVRYNGEPISELNQPPPNNKNIEGGTADEFMWKVYGLGLRGAMKGVIFNHVTWVDEFPDIDYIYGNDFGFTADPNALLRYAEDDKNIWIELLCYAPVETADELEAVFESVYVERHKLIVCDSSDKYTGENKGTVEMVRELRDKGWEAKKVSKRKSILFGLLSMKKKKIHIVKNHLWKHAKKERENYKFKEVNGILINQPGESHNHMWDACFIGETLIHTKHGQIPIRDIKEGDMVYTSSGLNKVNHVFDNGIKKTTEYRMLFDTFSLSFQCTSNHKIKTSIGWMEISELEKGMTVYLSKDLTEKSIRFIKEKGIFREGREECISLCGSFLTAKDTKGLTFTTKTMTRIITKLKILKSLGRLNINPITLNKELKTTLSGLIISIKKVLRVLKFGTEQKKGKNGTANTQKKQGLAISFLENTNAMFARFLSLRKTLAKDSAQTNANQNIEELQALIKLKSNALYAKNNLNIINTRPLKLVRLDVIGSTERRVFDLSVDNQHEYFANGLLVHNCRYCHISYNDDYFII